MESIMNSLTEAGTVRRLQNTLIAAGLALGLGACATFKAGPDYVPPVLPTSEHFHEQPGNATGAVPINRWWEGFGDPELSRLMARVQSHNVDLDIAMARVQQARAAVNGTDAALLPSGAAGLQAASEHQSLQSPIGLLAQHTPGYQRDMTLYDSALSASWELDISGGLHRAGEAAMADAQASEAERLAVLVMVQADAGDAYFRMRGAQARIALALEEIKDDADLLAVVNLRLVQGLATQQEQAEAEARLYQVRASVPALRHEVDVQSNRLDVLMGDAPGTFAANVKPPASDIVIPAGCHRRRASPGRIERAHRCGQF
jgi:outer membrane protein TolC